MFFLKFETAATVKIGPFLDSTDGNTAETGLTISQADVRLSKNGGNMAQKNEGSSCTHDELGYYDCDLDTTDTGTLGRLKLMVHESGALAVWHEFMVVPANVYDSLVGGTDSLEVDATAISGDTTAADNAESFFDGTGYAGTNNVIPTVSTLTGHTAQTGDNYARLGAPAGASIAADIAAIEAQTDDIGAAGAGLTAVPWNAAWDAEVQSEVTDALNAYDPPTKAELDSGFAALNDLTAAEVNAEVDTALADIHLDHLLAATYDPASKPGAADALLNELVEDDAGVSRYTVNALENAPSGTGASAETIADAVWDEALSGHTGAGSAGKAVADIETDATAILADSNELQTDWTDGGRLDLIIDAVLADTNELQSDDVPSLIAALPTAAENRAEMDSNSTQLTAIVADTNELQSDDVPGLIAALNDPTAAAIADQVWEEAIADHSGTAGSTAEALDGASAPTAADVADAVWDESLAAHVGAGSTGKQLSDVALTDELPSSPPTVAQIADAVWTEALADHSGTGGSTAEALDAIETDAAAILVDTAALNDTALPDSVPADGSIPTLKQAVYMINQFLLERAVAGTTVTVKKVDGSTSLMTLTLNDGTTPTSITRST